MLNQYKYVKSEVKDKVIVLTLKYDRENIKELEFRENLRKEIEESYSYERKKSGAGPSCVVQIDSNIVSSVVNKALYALWKLVAEQLRGKVFCVNYPREYYDGLTALGFLGLKGFFELDDIKSAIEQAKR